MTRSHTRRSQSGLNEALSRSVGLALLAGLLNPAAALKAAALEADTKNEQVARTEDKPAETPEVPSALKKTALEPRGEASLQALIKAEARREAIEPEIVDAVISVESGYNPDVIGSSGEIGLMQILPSTARMLGFEGSLSELAVPSTNMHYGTTYLAQAWRLAGGDLCTTVMKYRAGHGETRFSDRSVAYCVAVRAHLQSRGFAVTGSVPVATFGEPASGLGRLLGGHPCRKACLLASGPKLPNLEPINKRLSELVWQTKTFVAHGL